MMAAGKYRGYGKGTEEMSLMMEICLGMVKLF